MKRLFVLLLALFVGTAFSSVVLIRKADAATMTVYQPFPAQETKPCFVALTPTFIVNAAQVVRVEAGTFDDFDGKLVTIFFTHTGRRAIQGDQTKLFLDGVAACK